jgi:tRNA pseudouridine38-40 synthase
LRLSGKNLVSKFAFNSNLYRYVTVCGDSFMLYQIRKMVATAVAVALGHIPASFVPVTLTRPARAATPLAPASTLYLKGAEFMSFRKSGDAAAEPGPPRLERLEPSARVQADIDAFQRAVLDPAMAPALSSDEWDVFTGNLFKLRIGANMDAVEAMTREHGDYLVRRAEQREQRAAREAAREAEAEAEAAEEEAAASDVGAASAGAGAADETREGDESSKEAASPWVWFKF